MYWSLFGKKRKNDEKNVAPQVEYWLENEQLVKMVGKDRLNVEFLFSYYNFFKKTKYILWLEQALPNVEGRRLMHLGMIAEHYITDGKVQIFPVNDDYQLINAILEMKKSLNCGKK